MLCGTLNQAEGKAEDKAEGVMAEAEPEEDKVRDKSLQPAAREMQLPSTYLHFRTVCSLLFFMLEPGGGGGGGQGNLSLLHGEAALSQHSLLVV